MGNNKGVTTMLSEKFLEWLEDSEYIVTSEDEMRKNYDIIIDAEGPIEIMGITFDKSKVLKELDETSYDTLFRDWIDSCDIMEVGEGYMEKDDYERAIEEFENLMDKEDE
jgi:hypothetical protein